MIFGKIPQITKIDSPVLKEESSLSPAESSSIELISVNPNSV